MSFDGFDLTIVDAFAHQQFAGNPAAVAVLESFPDEAVMQAVACEMHLSETAYVVPRADGDHDLRWFTPTVEVDLCGHATLASAHVLGGSARFHTRSGLLSCTRLDDGWIEMNLPADPPQAATPPETLQLDGIVWYGVAKWDAVVELKSASIVRELEPDLADIETIDTRALIVTAPGDRPGVDCVSRVFAPNAGIPEDPVTGSAHCTLAALWSAKLGRDHLVGEQASRRGGLVRMRLCDDKVAIAGQAVTTAHVTFAGQALTTAHVELAGQALTRPAD